MMMQNKQKQKMADIDYYQNNRAYQQIQKGQESQKLPT